MDASRLTLRDNGFRLAVAIRRESRPLPHTHAGLCYRDGSDLWLLHLAWDRKMEHESFDGSYVCAVPAIPRFRWRFFLRLCRAMRNQPSTFLRYALRHPANARFQIQNNGEVVLT